MKRGEDLIFREQFLPVGTKRRSGILMNKVLFFVDHDTGNANSTAQNNVTYYINSANEMSASAHVFVDDKEAIICIPCLAKPEKAWHVQYNKVRDNALYGDDANDAAIGLELCYFPEDQERSLKAYNNYIEVAAYLAKYHRVNPSERSGHFELDSERRTDPNNALKYIGKTYEDMKRDIVSIYKILLEKEESTMTDQNQEVSTWAKEAREWVIANNISDGTNPKNETTREELWTMLYRFFQLIKS